MQGFSIHRWENSNSVEIQMTIEIRDACSHQGSCDADVEKWVNELRPELEKIPAEVIAINLKSYGAWDEEELKDREQNLRRFLWCAAGQAKETGGCYAIMEP